MRRVLHGLGMLLIFAATSAMWLVFTAVMAARTDAQEDGLAGEVAELWGQPLEQAAPSFTRVDTVIETRADPVYDSHGQEVWRDGTLVTQTRNVAVERRTPVATASTALEVTVGHDPRRKGLIWFSLYDVHVDGRWTATFDGDAPGRMLIHFPFPQYDGIYDDFVFEVDGKPAADRHTAANGVEAWVDAAPGQVVELRVAYRSRGRDQFVFRPTAGIETGEIRDFRLALHTDFADIDFPGRTLSPSDRARTDDGWTLVWRFEHLVSGSGMGVVTPSRVQPGELAAKLSLTAPISLALFTAWISVLGLLRGIAIHPVNHAFLAGAFFSFHLLFGYTADHLPVEAAFVLSSAVSVFLTVSYLRLVAGPRFAVVQAGGAQVLYQVVFSLAHFVDGMTGLTLTVLLIGTLFALMQLTGRVRWAEVLDGSASVSG